MIIRFAAINILDPASADYVKVGSRIKDTTTGEQIVLAKCEIDPFLTQALGSDRAVLEGRVVGKMSTHKYTLPLDDADGTLNGFDRIG